MHDAPTHAEADILQDRLELLRLRTLAVGVASIVGLLIGLLLLTVYASQTLKLALQATVGSTAGIHVPSNLFQAPADEFLTRIQALFPLAFVAIGIGGISFMTRQVLGGLQIRLWYLALCGLTLCIVYVQSDFGSVWSAPHRDVVQAVRAKDWARAEKLLSVGPNLYARRYVLAQIGLAKPDAGLLQLHGKTLVDQIDASLMHGDGDADAMASDNSLLNTADNFDPRVLKDIDVAVYGAPHTEIGLSLTQSAGPEKAGISTWFRELARALFATVMAAAAMGLAYGLLQLWRRMSARLLRLRSWVVAN